MKSRILAVLAAAAIAATCLAGDAKQEITRAYQTYAKLLVAKDYVGIERFLEKRFTLDFTARRADGKEQTLADMWEANRRDMAAKKAGRADGPTTFDPRVTSVRVKGNVALVYITTDGKGEWLQGNRRLPVVFRQLTQATWVLEDGVWKAKRFEELSMKGTVDGKPFGNSN
jgi:hypothetical protein